MKSSIPLLALAIAAWACNTAQDNNPPYVPPKKEVALNKIDKYLYDNNGKSMLERYGTVVRYRFDNRMKELKHDVAPVRTNVVIPVTQLIEYLAVQTYKNTNPYLGDQIVDALLPLEINYLGSGAFDAGRHVPVAASATRFQMNLYALNYVFTGHTISAPRARGLVGTLHHELVHVANAKYGYPEGYARVSPKYNGNRFQSIVKTDAIKLGMVSAYGTKNKMEDIAELVAYYIRMKTSAFKECFLVLEPCDPVKYVAHKCGGEELALSVEKTRDEHCRALNEGKKRIAKKLDIAKGYYQNELKINLDTLGYLTRQRLYDPKLLENILKQ